MSQHAPERSRRAAVLYMLNQARQRRSLHPAYQSLRGWKHRTMATWATIAFIILLFGSIIFAYANLVLNQTTDYQQMPVNRGDFLLTTTAIGLLQSGIYNLNFHDESGRLTKIYVHQGQYVTQGQVLAQIDSVSLQDLVNAAHVAVYTAQNNLSTTLAHRGQTLALINARIASASVAVHRAEDNLYAINGQANANLTAAEIALTVDQTTLNQIKKVAATRVHVAQLQRQKDLATCVSSNTATSTTNNTPPPANNGGNIPGTLTNPVTTGIFPSTPTVLTIATTTAKTPTPTPQATSSSNTYENCVSLAQQNYHHDVEQAQADVDASTAQVRKDTTVIEQTHTNTNVNITQVEGSVQLALSLVRVEAEETAPSEAVIEEVAAEGQLECAYALLDAANHNLDHTILIAPHDGVVSTINGTVGGPPGVPINVAPGTGAGAGGIFIQLVDLNDVQQIEAYVKESDIERVQIGQSVQFTVRAYGTHIFSGTVSELLSNGLASTESPNGLITPNDITFPVIINIDPQSSKGMHLLPNMTANATIMLENNTQALLVPASAVTFAQSASTGQAALINQQQVNAAKIRAQRMLTQMENRSPDVAALWPQATYVLERSNDGHSLKVVPVILELGTNGTYEVLAGLQEGDNVVISAPSRLHNVKIAPALHSHTH